MTSRLRLLAQALALGTALATVGSAASAETLRLMTGPQGGVWVPLGGALKNMFEKAIPGVTVQTLPGAGIANVRGIDEGKAEIGFGNSITTVDAIEGRAPFPKKADNVCQLATLYPQYFQVVVLADAKIDAIKDLKGKSIAVQTRGNTAGFITQQILQAEGLAYRDMKVNFQASYTDAISLMKDGHAQAFTLGTALPASSVMDLGTARDVKLLDLSGSLDAMKKLNSGYTLVTVPANTYPKQDKDTKVIGYATHVVVSCKLPEAQAYAMVKSMASNIPEMSALNKDIKSLTPQMMAEDIGVPFHPGAKRFYTESGVKM